MSAPFSDNGVVSAISAESLLGAFTDISATDRRLHASVFNYWLSIRGNQLFPPIRDLDPLEISDAGPRSVLLELVGGGEDAEIRHLGRSIRQDVTAEKICDAPSPSFLTCIAARLPIVASSREAIAFEEEYSSQSGPVRCWVTLLPFSSSGSLIDYVYALVTLSPDPEASEAEEPVTEEVTEPEEIAAPEEEAIEDESGTDDPAEPVSFGETQEPDDCDAPDDVIAEVLPAPEESISEDQAEKPTEENDQMIENQSFETTQEGGLLAALEAVRAKAEESRAARLRSHAALCEGLGAAYDFAIDAEEAPNEYLRLVDGQGLRIQLRSPMEPVIKLGFGGIADSADIARLEAVLAWALKSNLERGTLCARIEEEGGLDALADRLTS